MPRIKALKVFDCKVCGSDIFSFVEPNTFVAVYSRKESVELFYLLKVVENQLQKLIWLMLMDIVFKQGHNILKGSI